MAFCVLQQQTPASELCQKLAMPVPKAFLSTDVLTAQASLLSLTECTAMMQIAFWVPPWEMHQFAGLPQEEQHLFADLHASLSIRVLAKQQPDTFSRGEIYMRDGTFEVVCISGLTAANKTEADWATTRQSTYEQCLKWFSDTAAAWMDYYATARPNWNVDYALPALQQHITLICKPIPLFIKAF